MLAVVGVISWPWIPRPTLTPNEPEVALKWLVAPLCALACVVLFLGGTATPCILN